VQGRASLSALRGDVVALQLPPSRRVRVCTCQSLWMLVLQVCDSTDYFRRVRGEPRVSLRASMTNHIPASAPCGLRRLSSAFQGSVLFRRHRIPRNVDDHALRPQRGQITSQRRYFLSRVPPTKANLINIKVPRPLASSQPVPRDRSKPVRVFFHCVRDRIVHLERRQAGRGNYSRPFRPMPIDPGAVPPRQFFEVQWRSLAPPFLA